MLISVHISVRESMLCFQAMYGILVDSYYRSNTAMAVREMYLSRMLTSRIYHYWKNPAGSYENLEKGF